MIASRQAAFQQARLHDASPAQRPTAPAGSGSAVPPARRELTLPVNLSSRLRSPRRLTPGERHLAERQGLTGWSADETSTSSIWAPVGAGVESAAAGAVDQASVEMSASFSRAVRFERPKNPLQKPLNRDLSCAVLGPGSAGAPDDGPRSRLSESQRCQHGEIDGEIDGWIDDRYSAAGAERCEHRCGVSSLGGAATTGAAVDDGRIYRHWSAAAAARAGAAADCRR